MSDDTTPETVKVQLGSNGTFTFASLEEIAAWVQKQNAFYRKLELRTVNDSISNNVKLHLDNALNEMTQALAAAKNQPLTEPLRMRTSSVRNIIDKHFGKGGVPEAGSARAKVVERFLSDGQPIRAAYALAYYLGLQLNHLAPAGLKGLFEAVLGEMGMAGDREVAVRLRELQAQWSASVDSAKQSAAQQQRDLDSQLAQQREAAQHQQRTLDAALQAATTQLQAHVADAESRLADRLKVADDRLSTVEKTYDERLALQAAVKYWEAKAKGHRCWAIVWAVAAFVVGIGATWFMNTHLRATLGETRVMDAQLWQVSKLAILAIFGVWLMRVVVRLMLSHTHLHTDANERRTMMLTYLAMMREGQLPEGQSRELILQALFRPTSTGIVKDDASPPFMAEWLRATVGKD